MNKHVDALIIGFGKGGKTLAPFLAAQGLSVAVVEKSAEMYGGTCINIGCIPTKALAHQAQLVSELRITDRQERSRMYSQAIREKDELVSLLRAKNFATVDNQPGAEVITGTAAFISPHEVRVETESGSMVLKAERIFVNTGARPFLPDIPGIGSSKVYTSTELLDLARLPERLVIVGSGPIGLEFASIYAGFGTEVTLIDRGGTFLPKADRDIAEAVQQVLEKKGIRISLQTKVVQITDGDATATVSLVTPDGTEELETEAILVAAGRQPNTDGLHLEAAGVRLTAQGFIQTDETLRTNVPHIWALGDVNGGPQFTYVSLDDYRIVRDQLYGKKVRTTLDRRFIPASTFIDPPLAHVGLTEREARAQGYNVKIGKWAAAAIPRARQLKNTDGLLKAIVDADTNRLLGFTMFAAESSEVINTVSVFMASDQPYTVLRDTIFTHPTMAEALNDVLAQV